MIKAIIFDCFGVLYPDTYWTMANEFLGEKFSESKAQLHELVHDVDMGRITRDDLWAKFAEIVGVPKDDIYERLKEFGGLDMRLLNFIEEKKPKYKIGMISNVGHGFLERMFIQRPAEYYFDEIILSSEVGLIKPDPKIYILCADNLGVKPGEAVFIDDLEKNSLGAERVGMKAIHYKSYDQFIYEINAMLEVADTDK